MEYKFVLNHLKENNIALAGNTKTPLFEQANDTSHRIWNALDKENLLEHIWTFEGENKSNINFQRIEKNPAEIYYQIKDSIYGELLIATSDNGVCWLEFNTEETFADLEKYFPKTKLINTENQVIKNSLNYLNKPSETEINLEIKGTDFQLKVWDALCKIPMGEVSTYKLIAEYCGNPNGSRAVGAAIGRNPIALLIPCHRTIKSDGKWQGFKWDNQIKAALLAYEQLK